VTSPTITLGEPVIHRHEDDDDALQEAWQQRVSNPKRARGEDGFSTSYLTKISKEIIYCRDGEVDGCPTLLYVTWGLDFGSAEMTLDANWIANPSRDELLRGIGLALAYEVPVVPDTADLAAELEALEREVLAHGFPLEVDGAETRLINSRYARADVDTVDALALLNRPEPIMPSEVRVLMATMQRELASRAEAGRMLAALRLAISEMSRALSADFRNEAVLQQCLTRHPILFGPE